MLTKLCTVKAMIFLVDMYGCQSWTIKKEFSNTVVLEKTLESPLDWKEIKQVNPKGNQSWIFIGSADAEAPIFWPPDAKNWLLRKDPDAGKDWRQEEKGMTEDEMGGRHHQLDGHEFEQTLGVGDGQGSMVCCSPWGHKELDTTEWLFIACAPWPTEPESTANSANTHGLFCTWYRQRANKSPFSVSIFTCGGKPNGLTCWPLSLTSWVTSVVGEFGDRMGAADLPWWDLPA